MKYIKTKAPARICLFGDHQDYLELPIIACAINRYIYVEGKENTSNTFEIDFKDLNEKRTLQITETICSLKQEDFIQSVIKTLQEKGVVFSHGMDVVITGDIPINAGVSSSSALTVAWTRFLLETFSETSFSDEEIAQLAFYAEVTQFGNPGGRMDQYSISLRNLLFMENKAPYAFKSIAANWGGLIVGVSGVPKDTIGLISHLKTNTFKAIETVKKAFVDFDIQKCTLNELRNYETVLNDDLKPFFRAAVGNHDVTQKALEELEKEVPNVELIGSYINEHHQYLKNDLKITVPTIDHMIEAALANGAYGAKIVGSGGGGCIAILAPKEKEAQIVDAVKLVGKDAFAVNIAS